MSRTCRITLLIIESLWLGVLMPGHTRGQISAMGDAARVCCSGDARREHSAKLPKQTCAVCYLVAMLDVPPPVTFVSPPTGRRLNESPIALTQFVFDEVLHHPDLARAPPACFAAFG